MESVQSMTHSGMIFRIEFQLRARLCCKIRKLTIPWFLDSKKDNRWKINGSVFQNVCQRNLSRNVWQGNFFFNSNHKSRIHLKFTKLEEMLQFPHIYLWSDKSLGLWARMKAKTFYLMSPHFLNLKKAMKCQKKIQGRVKIILISLILRVLSTTPMAGNN